MIMSAKQARALADSHQYDRLPEITKLIADAAKKGNHSCCIVPSLTEVEEAYLKGLGYRIHDYFGMIIEW